MALAAAEQGKFEAFHTAMFEAGRVTPETILAAARTAGVEVLAYDARINAGAIDMGVSLAVQKPLGA